LGAGVIQGLDNRDSDVSTSGLYQALTYQAGLSGGSWLLSSLAGNNYPTVTELKTSLWEQAFQDSLLDPEFLLAAVAYAKVVDDIIDKNEAGFPPTLTDPWGRLLSYQLLKGTDGGVATTLSSLTTLSNFTSYNVPYPIITARGVKTFNGECLPGPNATMWEFGPYEFGSWGKDIAAFTPTKYLGTTLIDGVATDDTCVEGYDNLGYVLGTSSTLFNQYCTVLPAVVNSTSSSGLVNDLAVILDEAHALAFRDEYAVYPNPFYNYSSTADGFFLNSANLIQSQTSLSLVDGGEALQNNPIFPLLQPERAIDVIIVNDNSADTTYNFPNGSEILTTYVQSLNAGLTRMPYIPSVATFISEGLNQRPTFFGCNDTDKVTIVYMPNYNYTTASNVSTSQLVYSKTQTNEMVANGVAIASVNGDKNWPVCLGCALLKKTGATLPTACTACFEKYCYTS
jgi:lysophospholipase